MPPPSQEFEGQNVMLVEGKLTVTLARANLREKGLAAGF
jgi:hypothetical protein